MFAILLVFLGAGFGGVLRHLINLAVAATLGSGFPWATMLINITGSLAMGLLAGWLAFRSEFAWSQHARLFIATGVLGGYTTFSTFSLEAIVLIERDHWAGAAFYVGGSLLLAIFGLWAGLTIMRSLS